MPLSKKRIGIVCPYGWDIPGGVQSHIGDLAEYLIAAGHHVSVLAPALSESELPDYVVNAGRPISIPYNGAIARVLFGPIAFARVRQWIAEGNFDLLHLHEPAIPSISLLACWAAEGRMIGTFHASAKKQKASFAIVPILEPVIEKLSARIAVSEAARQTLRDHLETDAVVIPNGINAALMHGKVRSEWGEQTLGFMGRFNEPRKGLKVLIDALPIISRFMPEIKVLVAGPGNPDEFLKEIDPQLRNRIQFLGRLTEDEKADFMTSVSAFVAPNTGGESFGIILGEAMACGTPIVASDLPAFKALLEDGKYGRLFESENPESLSATINDLFSDSIKRNELGKLGFVKAQELDWEKVASAVFGVYELALASGKGVRLSSEKRIWNRFRTP